MENVLVTNNGQMAWQKLSTFGLHSRRSHIGFNRYAGQNGAIYLVDKATGMKVMFQSGQKPRSERERFYSFVSGKRGRPAKFGPVQFKEPQKRGRKPLTAEQKAEREAIKAELAGLVFFGPQRKRGPKPNTIIAGAEGAINEPKKRGRVSEADRLKAAKAGDIIPSKGGHWVMLAAGLPSWVAA